jgi:eukaryotic-like serine/threonine-protein kinase
VGSPSYRDELGRPIPSETSTEPSRVVRRNGNLRLPKPAKLPVEASRFLKQGSRHPSSAYPRAGAVPTLPIPEPVAQLGPYGVLGRVSHDADSELFRAVDTRSDKGSAVLALRLVHAAGASPAAMREALSCARRATQLSHPNLCHVLDAGVAGRNVYLASEWLEGRSLPDLVATLSQRGEGLSPALIAYLVAQAAYALDGAHRARDERGSLLDVLHRRLHPGSIVIGLDGAVKLRGFGMPAPVMPSAESDDTAERALLGYRAPEQLLGGAVDARSDVFALGVCLYELLTGMRLHRRATVRGTVSAVLDERPTSLRASLPELPELLDVIVLRALEKRPEHRFQRASELAMALDAYLASQPEPVSPRRLGRLMQRLYAGAQDGPKLERDDAALTRLRLALSQGEMRLESEPPPPVQTHLARRTLTVGLALASITGALVWLLLR